MASPATVDADGLCALLASARDDSNRLLDTLARERRVQTVRAQDPPLLYAPASSQPQSAIAAADFHPPYALTLAALEMTLHGYCVLRKFGWQRRTEAVFSLGRPPFWRRLLRPPTVLALRLSVQEGAALAAVLPPSAPAGTAYPGRQEIRLAPALQEALLQLHRAHRAPPWYWRRSLRRSQP